MPTPHVGPKSLLSFVPLVAIDEDPHGRCLWHSQRGLPTFRRRISRFQEHLPTRFRLQAPHNFYDRGGRIRLCSPLPMSPHCRLTCHRQLHQGQLLLRQFRSRWLRLRSLQLQAGPRFVRFCASCHDLGLQQLLLANVPCASHMLFGPPCALVPSYHWRGLASESQHCSPAERPCYSTCFRSRCVARWIVDVASRSQRQHQVSSEEVESLLGFVQVIAKRGTGV